MLPPKKPTLDSAKTRAEIAKLNAEAEKAKQETLKIQSDPTDLSRRMKIFLQISSAWGPLLVTLATGAVALLFAGNANLFDSQTRYAQAEQKLAEAKQMQAAYETEKLNDKKDSLSKVNAILQRRSDSLAAADSLAELRLRSSADEKRAMIANQTRLENEKLDLKIRLAIMQLNSNSNHRDIKLLQDSIRIVDSTQSARFNQAMDMQYQYRGRLFASEIKFQKMYYDLRDSINKVKEKK